MLSPEDAKKELDTFQVSGAGEELERRLGGEPKEIAEIGLAFLKGVKSNFREADRAAELARFRLKCSIDSLVQQDRFRLFQALFPPIAKEVEASWELQRTMPYQSGFSRRAFHSPGNPENSLKVRVGWVEALLRVVIPYRYDLDFLITWGASIGWYAEQPIGILLAGALASGNQQASRSFESLRSIINGEHTKARLGRFTVIAMLSSPSPDAWTAVENLMLAAQRQEGLRQVVLEAIDFANPQAFRRMLRLIEDQGLTRFAAVARAVAVWFGLTIDSSETRLLDHLVHDTLMNLESHDLCSERIRSASGEDLYVALWAVAYEDIDTAVRHAEQLLEEPNFERRYPAVYLLAQAGTPAALGLLTRSLSDADLRIALTALQAIPVPYHHRIEEAEPPEIFTALQELLARMPEGKQLKPAIWPWNKFQAKRSEIASRLIWHRGSRPFAELAQYVPDMDASGRALLLNVMTKQVVERKRLLREEREIAFSMLSDLSETVREHAFKLMQLANITPEEALTIEPLLSRKASDLRRGVIRLLLKQDAAHCRASIERLASSGDPLKMKAAEELKSELEPAAVSAATLADGFGLFQPEKRTAPAKLRGDLIAKISSAVSDHLLSSLDELIAAHRETSVTIKGYNDQETQQLLGNLRSLRQGPDFPLKEAWAEWWNSQSAGTIDLTRALCTRFLYSNTHQSDLEKSVVAEFAQAIPLKFGELAQSVLWHLLESRCNAGDIDFMLNVLETQLHRVSIKYKPEMDSRPSYISYSVWRISSASALISFLRASSTSHQDSWTKELWSRFWGLQRWFDEGLPSKSRSRPALATTLAARKHEAASEADVYEQIIGRTESGGRHFHDLKVVTRQKQNNLLHDYPWLAEVVSRCRARILEVELKRGELPTEASGPALSLSSAFGAELALTILHNLGDTPLERGYIWTSESKAAVFSHLLRVCLPVPTDSPARFKEIAAAMSVERRRLIELAVYAPQWATYSETATGITGLAEAAFWLHAHTKDSQWTVEKEIRELWFAEVSERTPLSREELLDGAVDISWFHRVREALSTKDWGLILDAGKFASGGNGHKRAELFATAIAGKAKSAALINRIVAKRHQDSVRALGLLPIPTAATKHQKEILNRYEVMQDFLRKSRTFGAQRQASEKLAYTIGLANLARNAGYTDPQRFSWAMEARTTADLAAGPQEEVDGAVKAILSINSVGEPELVYEKAGKSLKDLPASLRKSPSISKLRERKTQLSQQTSRMRRSLEESMVRGDKFTIAELAEMRLHPMLKPMLSALLFVDETGKVRWEKDLDHAKSTVRIAHPVDLINCGEWPSLQRACIEDERVQPFKQAFRELYLLTGTERDAKNQSPRYSGQQINPQAATAIAGKRGWINVPEEGLRKTFHELGLSAWVTFLEGWFTPVDVDGLTVADVIFTDRATGKPMPLDQVEPRIFSEVMRDIDLVVSVAHRGGVDPEATHSTVEMRSALLRELIRLIRLQNVRIDDRHAFIDGKIGSYNVHLGSGIVHRQPGGSLCIIPVHSQHRGRIFLPFADNDPKAAEIISKVLLLAQDDKISDPTILEQLR